MVCPETTPTLVMPRSGPAAATVFVTQDWLLAELVSPAVLTVAQLVMTPPAGYLTVMMTGEITPVLLTTGGQFKARAVLLIEEQVSTPLTESKKLPAGQGVTTSDTVTGLAA